MNESRFFFSRLRSMVTFSHVFLLSSTSAAVYSPVECSSRSVTCFYSQTEFNSDIHVRFGGCVDYGRARPWNCLYTAFTKLCLSLLFSYSLGQQHLARIFLWKRWLGVSVLRQRHPGNQGVRVTCSLALPSMLALQSHLTKLPPTHETLWLKGWIFTKPYITRT